VAGRLALKWPNDLLLDGGKAAGILVEGENLAGGRRAVAIGVGVNCVSHPDVEGLLPAVDFAGHGIAVDAEALFAALAAAMDRALAVWDRGQGFAAIRTAWLARAAGLGAPVRVNLEGRSAEGRFEALDEAGRLVLAMADGRREAFGAGDVFPLAAG
jgi:BirA family biotin operon repressor/biotin-[acetyl-CoA-carboxylase] ligase